MKTRLLETQRALRASVRSADVLELGPQHVLLATSAVVSAQKKAISSADAEMMNRHKLAGLGTTAEGRLRIDVVSDNVLRIRYREGTSIPENATPMLAGWPPAPTRCVIRRDDQDTKGFHQTPPWVQDQMGGEDRKVIVIETESLQAVVRLKPYRIEITSPEGRTICGIGGPEKDNFCAWDAINTGVCRISDDGSLLATECFDLSPTEAIFGLGEKFIQLNKVGQTIDLDMIDALGVTTPRSYKNVPLMISTRGYGVYFNHSSRMTWWIGSRSAADVQVAAEDDFLDYFVILGDIKQVLHTYTDLTGKGVLPPKWSFGYWQSKFSYKSAEETLELARKMREHELPCDVIHLDTHWFKDDWYCDLEFAKDRFPDPAAYFQQMSDLGIKISLWQLPYIPEGSKLFDDLKAVDGFVKNATGEIYNCGVCFVKGFKGVVGVVDYTNPAAVKVHQEHFRRLFALGAKVIKTDFGEAAPLEGVYHDGTPGHRMHNLYPLLYNKAVFEVTKQETGDGVVWARAAWAGNQRYPLHWGGDNSPNFFNLVPQLTGGLSFGLSGFQFWSQDIGGFLGTMADALLVRWFQFGMFNSHSRVHGWGERELYKQKPATMCVLRDYLHLRYRLMPYIYGSAMDCVARSLPMLRAMVVEYQQDRNTWNLTDQYLFGSSMLVAPIFTEEDGRQVYLPEGVWTDWWTGRRIPGGRWIEVEAALETLPLYLREGAIIPLGPVMNYVDEVKTRKINLRVALFEGDGRNRFEVPVDGQLIGIEYVSSGGRHTLAIPKSDVEFEVETLGSGQLVTRRN